MTTPLCVDEVHDVRVEFAFGFSLTNPPVSGSWVDVTNDLLDYQVTNIHGRQDEESGITASRCNFILINTQGNYTPDHPLSIYYPNVVVGTPVHVSVVRSDTSHFRFIGQVSAWNPTWPHGDLHDPSLDIDDLHDPDADPLLGEARVFINASGITQQLTQGAPVLQSAMRRAILSADNDGINVITAYWPLEDESGATEAISMVTNASPMRLLGLSESAFGEIDAVPGSLPLPNMRESSSLQGFTLPTGDFWSVGFVMQMTSTNIWPAVDIYLTGSSLYVKLQIHFDTVTTLFGYDDDDNATSIDIDTGTNPSDGNPHWVEVRGTSASLNFFSIGVDGNFDNSALGSGHGRPRRIDILARPSGDPATIGHMVVAYSTEPIFNGPNFWPLTGDAMTGYFAEADVDRAVRLSGEEGIRLDVIGDDNVLSPLFEDNFNRTVATGWGGEWTEAVSGLGTASTSVTPGSGIIEITSSSARVYETLNDELFTNVEVLVEFTPNSGATFLAVDFGVLLDFVDTNNHIRVSTDWINDNTRVLITEITSGAINNQFEKILPLFPNATTWMRVRFENGVIRARSWSDTEVEPSVWHVRWDGSSSGDAGVVGVTMQDTNFMTAPMAFNLVSVRNLPTGNMGIQRVDTYISNLQDVEDVNGGVIDESLDFFGYEFRPLSNIVNQELIALPLNATVATGTGVGDIINPFTPVLDDQNTRNDVITSRDGGSSARAFDANHIAQHGRFETSVNLNVAYDELLAPQAAFRLWIGTQGGMRYPSVVPALNVNPNLIDTWLDVRTGDRNQVTGLPPQHPTDVVESIIRGWTETITPWSWDVRINTTPYRPYILGVYGDCRGLVLNGVNNDYASTPDNPSFAVTNLDIRVLVQRWDNWAPAADQTIVAQYDTSANRAWRLSIDADGGGDPSLVGRPFVVWSFDGSSTPALFADAVVSTDRVLLRATLVPNDGGGNSIVTFYTSPSESFDGPWVQLGSILTGGASSIFDSTTPLTVGAYNDGVAEEWLGDILAVEIRDGIDGTIIASPDFRVQDEDATEFDDDQGNTWTIGGTAAIVNGGCDVISPVSPTRRDTAGSETFAAFTSGTDTELQVFTTLGPIWAMTGAANLHLPFDVVTSGVRLRVTGITPVILDTFSRTVTGGWGTSDTGDTWLFYDDTGGPIASVNGSEGLIDVVTGAGATTGITYIDGLDIADLEIVSSIETDSAASFTGIAFRISSANPVDCYTADINSGSGTLELWANDGGGTLLAAYLLDGWAVNTPWWVRVRATGEVLQAKAWPVGEAEPGGWQVSAVDSTYTSGSIGHDVFVDGVGTFDNFQLVNPQVFTVEQDPINRIRKPIAVGSDVRLWQPAIRSL